MKRYLLIGPLLLAGSPEAAAVTSYNDQASFLADLNALSTTVAHEGFESDAVWGHVRTTIAGPAVASSVSNLGVTWTSNNQSSNVTTSSGAARGSSWGIFALPHGSYYNPDPGTNPLIPGDAGDGFIISADTGLLYGFGGWVRTNTPFAKVGLYTPTYNGDVDGGYAAQTIGTTAMFFGVIDPDGFSQIEFRELEGKLEIDGGDTKFIFADDFYFAGTNIVPEPSGLALLLVGGLGVLTRRRSRFNPLGEEA